mgnify:CR=1 FL=1
MVEPEIFRIALAVEQPAERDALQVLALEQHRHLAVEAQQVLLVPGEIIGAGGNILVRTASAGQVLVDSGAAQFTGAVLARLRELVLDPRQLAGIDVQRGLATDAAG